MVNNYLITVMLLIATNFLYTSILGHVLTCDWLESGHSRNIVLFTGFCSKFVVYPIPGSISQFFFQRVKCSTGYAGWVMDRLFPSIFVLNHAVHASECLKCAQKSTKIFVKKRTLTER